MTDSIDYKKQWKEFYQPSAKQPVILTLPVMNYLMIDGSGNPNTTPLFQDAIATLYPLSYALRFEIKRTTGISYTVLPLEGLYWGTPQNQMVFSDEDKGKWSWTLMICQPDLVTKDLFEAQKIEVKKKKSPPLIDQVRFESLEENTVVQMMHIGPFDEEAKTVEKMNHFAFDQGYQLSGKHHEIYMNDFRKTAPEKLKTVLRHPIKK